MNCPVCEDTGSVPISKPMEAAIDGIEFDMLKKVPCPFCPAGRRVWEKVVAEVHRLDEETPD